VDTVHEVTDGRTEGQTDTIAITKTVQRIASHGKNGWIHRLGYNVALIEYHEGCQMLMCPMPLRDPKR